MIKKVEKASGVQISPKTSRMSFNLIITGRNESMNLAKTLIVKLLVARSKPWGKMIKVKVILPGGERQKKRRVSSASSAESSKGELEIFPTW